MTSITTPPKRLEIHQRCLWSALLVMAAGCVGCANLAPMPLIPPPANTPLPTALGAASQHSSDPSHGSANEMARPAEHFAGPTEPLSAPGSASENASAAASDSRTRNPAPASAASTAARESLAVYLPTTPSDQPLTIRGQDPSGYGADPDEPMPGQSGHLRGRMSASGSPGQGDVVAAQYIQPGGDPSGQILPPALPPAFPPITQAPLAADLPTVPFDVFVEEGRTGRFMFGMGINSEAGLTGQVTVDERNFDIAKFPTSWDDIRYGRAFRGAGQGFRLEAMPGNQVQRYAISFTEPYLGGTDVSFRVSGFLFDRGYTDWSEQRLGGRVALGYRLTPDLSLSGALRMENVNIRNPRVPGVPELEEVVGDNQLYSGRVALAHDTRDTPFAATQGHFLEFAYEQVFGTFNYPRAELDWRRYFLIRERPDQSGRHTLAFTTRLGVSGEDTPIFENFFAGGFSTMRGFDFRGASPRNMGAIVGGRFQSLSSVEYMFPITQDDMIKGVVFVDYGTVEEDIKIDWNDYRVAPGFGLRINIPALGPAPLALDLAVPVAKEAGDDIQNFSFYFGFGRG